MYKDVASRELLLGEESEHGHAWVAYTKRRLVTRRLLLAVVGLVLAVTVFGSYAPQAHSVKDYIVSRTRKQMEQRRGRLIAILDSHLPTSAQGHQQDDYGNQKWVGKTFHPTTLPHVIPHPVLDNPVNDTLGFGALYALNLEYRKDKKYEIDLINAATGLQFQTLPGVDASTISRKGLPWVKPSLKEGALGAYLSHLGAYRKIVESNIKTAVILEDDFDADINLRTGARTLQAGVAQLMASLNNAPRTPTSDDPWLSEDWDVLWLGHCGDTFYEKNMGFEIDWDHYPIVLYQDPTVPERKSYDDWRYFDQSNLWDYVTEPSNGTEVDENISPRHRMIARANRPICSIAYAVSQRGARKLMYYMSRSVEDPLDCELATMCTKGALSCYEPWPPLFGQWRTKAGMNSDIHYDTDLKKFGQEQTRPHFNPSVGDTRCLRNSVRQHLGEILFEDATMDWTKKTRE